MTGLRMAFLYNHPWGHEFDNVEREVVPVHRLFGASVLAGRGHDVGYLRRTRRRPTTGRWLVDQALWVMTRQRRFDVIVATHEAAAVPVLALARLGLVRTPVAVLTVAATRLAHRSGLKGNLYAWALGGASLLTVYARAQLAPLRELVGPAPEVVWLPLGVDVEFFTPPTTAEPRARAVLSVGTNEGKDFPTLMAALPAGLECLVVTDEANHQAALATPTVGQVSFDAAVQITRLRRLYATCGVHVIPLREVELSSGQTVLLENLAMGTPLVVSDVTGIADYVEGAPTEVVRVVPAGDPVALREAVAASLGEVGEQEEARRASARRKWVMGRFDIGTTAARLEELLVDLVSRADSADRVGMGRRRAAADQET